MLKKNITKAEFAKLPEVIQKEYREEGDGYLVDIEGGFENVDTLKRAKDHEKAAAAEAKKLLKTAQDELTAVQDQMTDMLKGAIPKADAEKLENSYKEKLTKQEKDLRAQITTMESNLQTMLVDNVATSLSAEISTSPAVLMPHIKSRLRAEIKDGKAVTRVVDAEGNVSASTVEDLKKEFLTNKQFAPILIASKGSGGGAGPNAGGGANGGKKPDFAKASPKEIAEWNKSQGVGSETFVRGVSIPANQ